MTNVMLKLLPQPIKDPLKTRIGNLALKAFGGPVRVLKYIPEAHDSASFAIPKHQTYNNEGESDGLPVPPRPLWIGYGNQFGDKGKEWYITSGKKDTDRMLEILDASDFSLNPGARVLEMGCAAGRMLRHLKKFSNYCEMWGVDINAPQVNWCKCNLSPPFYFATTTTIPHLPFGDSYFDLIYIGSVFTHIDDLAEAWLLELRRVLSPKGRLYVTVHDRHTIKLLDNGYFYDKTGYFTDRKNKEVELTTKLNYNSTYRSVKDTFGMLVIGRDYQSQVFYDIEYFRKVVESCMYEILSVTEEAYGYQTAVLLKSR